MTARWEPMKVVQSRSKYSAEWRTEKNTTISITRVQQRLYTHASCMTGFFFQRFYSRLNIDGRTQPNEKELKIADFEGNLISLLQRGICSSREHDLDGENGHNCIGPCNIPLALPLEVVFRMCIGCLPVIANSRYVNLWSTTS